MPQSWLPDTPIDQFFLVIGLIVAAFVTGAAFHWLRNYGFTPSHRTSST
ncbi:MAG: hypothetical protein J07HN6_00630, partial [Halonotius sp. J07HN6]